MTERPLTFDAIGAALGHGWRTANATRAVSIGYAGIFTVIGAVIIGSLVAAGRTPFIVPAAGAFMLIGPALLAGFFAIAQKVGDAEARSRGPACGDATAPSQPSVGIPLAGATPPLRGAPSAASGRAGGTPSFATVARGFAGAAASIWVIALVCALLFMIFITDVAILYSYMVGGDPIFPRDMLPTSDNVLSFMFWGLVSGAVIALLLFAISAFSVPLLCARRARLVEAVVTSVRIVFGNLIPALGWAILLSAATIGSILLLPLFPLVLPVMAYASHALYQSVLPESD